MESCQVLRMAEQGCSESEPLATAKQGPACGAGCGGTGLRLNAAAAAANMESWLPGID